MSFSHHGEQPEDFETIKRFLDQMNGTGQRKYPAGRMGHEDDGVLSYAITNDDRHRTIIIRFGKPVEWIGLGVEDAEALMQSLADRVNALKGITA